MKLLFRIGYNTAWGESLYLLGSVKELGEWNESKALKMTYEDGIWSTEVDIKRNVKSFEYCYIVRNDNGAVRKEWGKPHLFTFGKEIKVYEILDSWNDQPYDKSFYSSMFVNSIFYRENKNDAMPHQRGGVTLEIFAPSVRPDEDLFVTGNCDVLGNWNPENALALTDCNYPIWSVAFQFSEKEEQVEYKFFKRNRHTGTESWEGCNNRVLDISAPDKNGCIVVAGLRFNDSAALWKGAGTAIPVFSIRTDEDFGAGDFLSIKKMVDWLAATGQRVLQILPINDTTMTHTWVDSYPYKANSTYALHPMYLNIPALGKLKDNQRQEYFNNLAVELNALPQVDYERVNAGKLEYVREIFAESGAKTLKTENFKSFFAKNEYWLKNYAAFCLLRDKFGTADFTKWGKYSKFDESLVDELCKDNADEINLTYYIQYNLDRQLKDSCDYAHKHGVVLKGDIPIGISRASADAWVDPDLFNLNSQAGAPPDDFSVLGQNWGLPTYNWERMSQDGFKWWKNRMRKMSEYFDLYRIDHILGFFRIWQIPMSAVHGLLGVFNPALPYTPDEMRNNYDFWINPDLQCKPYIMDYFLADFFGEYTEEAKSLYLESIGGGRYKLKPEVDTQQKVAELFASYEKNDKNNKLENALCGLLDEVLFIEDPEEHGKYHPRISAQFTYIYRSLNDYEKWCFNRMYNDFYYHRHNDFWYGKTMWKLPALVNSTDMLVCGEDLGMIPDCVPAVMKQLQILSLEIQRMPKNPEDEFGNPYQYPYLSVCTTSTHDMGGIRQWWEENHDKTQRFYNTMLHQEGGAPFYAEPWLCDIIVSQHLESPSMLTVLPWQDWMSIDGKLRKENPNDEQINVPAIAKHYWRYRMHISVESLMKESVFNENIKNKITRTGRN